MKKYKSSGWFNESVRHGLAARGVKTGRKSTIISTELSKNIAGINYSKVKIRGVYKLSIIKEGKHTLIEKNETPGHTFYIVYKKGRFLRPKEEIESVSTKADALKLFEKSEKLFSKINYSKKSKVVKPKSVETKEIVIDISDVYKPTADPDLVKLLRKNGFYVESIDSSWEDEADEGDDYGVISVVVHAKKEDIPKLRSLVKGWFEYKVKIDIGVS